MPADIDSWGQFASGAIEKMRKRENADITFLAAGILLTGAIFTLDLFLPLGAADGMLYLVVVMLLASSPSGKRFMVPLAATCSILTVLGTFYSPPGGVLLAGIINRFLTLFAIWGVTILSLQERRTKENQSNSEERFRDWSDAAFDGVVVHEQGRILQANQSLARMFGYEFGELGGMAIVNLAAPESRSLVSGKLDSNGNTPYEAVGLRKNGSTFLIEISSRVRPETDVSGGLLVVQDLTERKRAEQRFHDLVHGIDTIAWEADAVTLKPTFVNHRAEEILGYPAERWLTDPDFLVNLIHPDDREHILSLMQSAISAGKDYELEFRALAADDRTVWLRNIVRIHRDPEGRAQQLRGVMVDISDRKQAEATLKESEERYRKLLENFIDGVILTVEGKITFVNPVMCELTGYSSEELRGRPPTELLAPEERERAREKMSALLAGSGEHPVVYHLLRKQGGLVPVEVGSRLIHYGGKPALMSVVHDITGRDRAEQALRKSVQEAESAVSRFRGLLEAAPEGIVIVNREGRIVLVNAQAERIFGYQKAELMGQSIDILFPENVRQLHSRHRADYHLHPSRRSMGEKLDLVAIRKDGSEFPIEISLSPLDTEYGTLVTTIIRDITDRKQAEQELRTSEERYRQLFENANDLVYTHDMEGNLTSFNKAGERITGYTREEALRMNIRELIAPQDLDTAREMMSRIADKTPSVPFELSILSKENRRIILEISPHWIYQKGKPIGIQGIGRDVTERTQLEEQLRQVQKMEAIGQLAGGVAHDFNNLLTLIEGYCELSMSHVESGTPLRKYIEAIHQAGERATSLTRQLLAFSRRQILQPRVLDLNSLVTDIEKMLYRLIGEEIELVTTLDINLGRVRVDPGQIDQVIMNLAVNARDAMPAGGKLILETRNVELEEPRTRPPNTVPPGSYVVLTVQDTGHGMDSETQAHMFEPFFTTKEQGKGTGLGLATVYGIVRQSGGSILVSSVPDQGTTFEIFLPKVTASLETEARPQKDNGNRIKGNQTIMVVEDEYSIRKLAREFLEVQGFKVLEASCGHEALEISEKHGGPLHLVMTDVVMPGMSGPELITRLSPSLPEMRVLYISGYADSRVVDGGLLNPGAEFLQKPFSFANLGEKLSDLLYNEIGPQPHA